MHIKKQENFGGEAEWRLGFENFLARNTENKDVPVVSILLNGGPTGIEACALRLELEQRKDYGNTGRKALRVPLIVVKGSKRSADLIAELCENKDLHK